MDTGWFWQTMKLLITIFMKASGGKKILTDKRRNSGTVEKFVDRAHSSSDIA